MIAYNCSKNIYFIKTIMQPEQKTDIHPALTNMQVYYYTCIRLVLADTRPSYPKLKRIWQ